MMAEHDAIKRLLRKIELLERRNDRLEIEKRELQARLDILALRRLREEREPRVPALLRRQAE